MKGCRRSSAATDDDLPLIVRGMKVIFRKTDLDTAMAALLLGVTQGDYIVWRAGGATACELGDHETICIEAGGSGSTYLMNFDHHDVAHYYPPACRQAYNTGGLDSPARDRLVEYVCAVDEARVEALAWPTLSNVFSGMLLTLCGETERLFAGITVLNTALSRGVDPRTTVPRFPEWIPYLDAKTRLRESLVAAQALAITFRTGHGLRAGYLETDLPGALGMLRRMGCEIAMAYSSNFGPQRAPRFTVASGGVSLAPLLAAVSGLEQGWGGRETIIGSPPSGTALTPEGVLRLLTARL
jgi:hypothetical protein